MIKTGIELQMLRKRKNVAVSTLARMMGVRPGTLSDIEAERVCDPAFLADAERILSQIDGTHRRKMAPAHHASRPSIAISK